MNAKSISSNIIEKMHRDFKPQNVLIGPEKDIKICDFGLAQSTHSIFVTGEMGTAIYAAPEVFLRSKNG
jgi:serine/threonine protein kinase